MMPPEGLFLRERSYQMELQRELREQREATLSLLREQNANFLTRTLASLNMTLQALNTKLRTPYLPATLAELQRPRLYAIDYVRPWTPSYPVPVFRGGLAGLFSSLWGASGVLPAAPYQTALEVAQEARMRQAVALPMLGAFLGAEVASLIPFYTLPFLPAMVLGGALSFVLPLLVSRLFATRQVGSIRRALSSTFTRPEQVGLTGPTPFESVLVYHEVLRTAARDVLLGSKEMMDLFARLTQSNLLLGVRDVQTFRKRFKELVDAVRTIAQNLHLSFEDAINLMQEMRQLGISSPAAMARYAALVRRTAIATGMAPQYVSGVTMGIAREFVGAGLSPEAALNVANVAMYTPAAIERVLGREALERLGGAEAAVEMASRLSTTILQHPTFSALLLGLADVRREGERLVARLNNRLLNQLLSGQLKPETLLQRAAQTLQRFPQLSVPSLRLSTLSAALATENAAAAIFGLIPVLASALYGALGVPPNEQVQLLLSGLGITGEPARILGEFLAGRGTYAFGVGIQQQRLLSELEQVESRYYETFQSPFRRFGKRILDFLARPFRWLRERVYEGAEYFLGMNVFPGEIFATSILQQYNATYNNLRNDVVRLRDLSSRLPAELKRLFEEAISYFGDNIKNVVVVGTEGAKKLVERYRSELRKGKNELEAMKSAIESVRKEFGAFSAGEAVAKVLSKEEFAAPERRLAAYGARIFPERYETVEDYQRAYREWESRLKRYEQAWSALAKTPTWSAFTQLAKELLPRKTPQQVLYALLYPEYALAAGFTEEERLAVAAAPQEAIFAVLGASLEKRATFRNAREAQIILGEYRSRLKTLKEKVAKATRKDYSIQEWLTQPDTEFAATMVRTFQAARKKVDSLLPNLPEKQKDAIAAYLVARFGDQPSSWEAALTAASPADLAKQGEGLVKLFAEAKESLEKFVEAGVDYMFVMARESLRAAKPEEVLQIVGEALKEYTGVPEETKTRWRVLLDVLSKNKELRGLYEKVLKGETVGERTQAFFEILRRMPPGSVQEMASLLFLISLGRLPAQLGRYRYSAQGGRVEATGFLTPEELQRLYGTSVPEEIASAVGARWMLFAPPLPQNLLQMFAQWLGGGGKEARLEAYRRIFVFEPFEVPGFPKPRETELLEVQPLSTGVILQLPEKFYDATETMHKAASTMKEAVETFRANVDQIIQAVKGVRSDAKQAR